MIVPSRGRAAVARALTLHFRNTCTADTVLIFAVDQDDPTRAEYETVGDGTTSAVLFTPSRTMVEALNITAVNYASQAFAIGFMGDDHCPRTYGWDSEYLGALRELGTGIVYGNDLLQGEKLPTQCAMTADIIRALGFMALPSLRHMYVDNFWLDLGREADRLFYLPDVVVEHMHPIAGKADWDEGHRRVNDQQVYDADAAAYAEYRLDRFAADVAKVVAL